MCCRHARDGQLRRPQPAGACRSLFRLFHRRQPAHVLLQPGRWVRANQWRRSSRGPCQLGHTQHRSLFRQPCPVHWRRHRRYCCGPHRRQRRHCGQHSRCAARPACWDVQAVTYACSKEHLYQLSCTGSAVVLKCGVCHACSERRRCIPYGRLGCRPGHRQYCRRPALQCSGHRLAGGRREHRCCCFPPHQLMDAIQHTVLQSMLLCASTGSLQLPK